LNKIKIYPIEELELDFINDKLPKIYIVSNINDYVKVQKMDNMSYSSYNKTIIISDNIFHTQNYLFIPKCLTSNGKPTNTLVPLNINIIVKKIHQIHINKQLYKKYIPLILSWINRNKDFEYHLWTDNIKYAIYFFKKKMEYIIIK
jgi:hypothetical protein